MGRLVRKDQPIDGKAFSIGYEYDQAGNIVKVKDPSNGATSYSVDGLGRITEVKRSTSSGGDQVIADYFYNSIGTIANISFFNGTRANYAYDNRDRIKTLKVTDPQGNILVRQDMGYDSVGNRISLNSRNEESVQYEYDNLSRLTKVSYPKDTEEFHYDNAGNRTSMSHAFGKMDYVYDPASNKLLTMKVNAQGKVKYSYDGNGNLIKEEHFSGDIPENVINYKYDPEDRLIEIEKPIQKVPGIDMPDVSSDKADYIYDNSGLRVKKITRNGGAKYIYDLANQVICETDDKGDIQSSYVYANNQRIAEIKADGTVHIFHNDALGSPALITDKELKEVQRNIYEPFGNLVVNKGTDGNTYTFTGKERDLESNLFYFGARYYNPILGRFISKDIANPDYKEPQTINRYIYCINNPLIHIDIDGNLSAPVDGRISSWYGARDLSIKTGAFHTGLDIANKLNSPIVAILPGKVIYTGYNNGYGFNVVIEHEYEGSTIYSHYSHLGQNRSDQNNAIFVRSGQSVSEHQKIGLLGQTGWVTGPHVDLELYTSNPIRNGALNPNVIGKQYRQEHTIDPYEFYKSNKSEYNTPEFKGTEYEINYGLTMSGGNYFITSDYRF
jgi:RHS repeat-associated protein